MDAATVGDAREGGEATPDRRRLTAEIGLFVALAFALSVPGYALVLANEGGAAAGRLYTVILMWAPALAAMLTIRRFGRDPASLGWRWGAWRWNRLGYLLPLFYVSAAYLVIWLGGLGGFAGPAEITAIADTLGWTDAHPIAVVVAFVLIKASAGLIVGLASALGEEIGWRGYLAPRIAALAGFTPGALLLGAIWTVWHLPLLLLGGYNNGTEWWFGLGCFTLMVTGLSVILTWLRLRSASLWPCAILHASHNLFIQGVFTPLTGAGGKATPYVTGEFGLAVPVAVALVAGWFWRRRREVAPSLRA